LPVFQVIRTANGKLPSAGSFARGEDVVGVPFLRHRWIMGKRDGAFERQSTRLLRPRHHWQQKRDSTADKTEMVQTRDFSHRRQNIRNVSTRSNPLLEISPLPAGWEEICRRSSRA